MVPYGPWRSPRFTTPERGPSPLRSRRSSDSHSPFATWGGVSAIVGHIFPFYLRFKGGEGAATASGLVLASLIGLWLKLPPSIGMADLAALAGFAGLSSWAVGRGDVIAVFLVPALAALSLLRFHQEPAAIFAALILCFIFALALEAVIRHRAFPYLPEDVRWWRVLLRPAGFSFPLLSLWVTKQTLLSLIGSVLALFVLVDLVRLSSGRVQSFFFKRLASSFKVYKEKERSRLSSMTLFLLGCFVTFLLFPLKVAFLAVTFLIFGDLTAKVFGFVGGKDQVLRQDPAGDPWLPGDLFPGLLPDLRSGACAVLVRVRGWGCRQLRGGPPLPRGR